MTNKVIEETVRLLKNSEKLNSLLIEGCELETFWNDYELLIRCKVLLDVDIIDFRLTTILDEVHDIVKSNMSLSYTSPYNTLSTDYNGYEVKYRIKGD